MEVRPEELGWLRGRRELGERLKIEALYEMAIGEQQQQVEEVRMDEQMLIPQGLDYFA